MPNRIGVHHFSLDIMDDIELRLNSEIRKTKISIDKIINIQVERLINSQISVVNIFYKKYEFEK